MPWEHRWVPAPQDESLPVLAALPEGVTPGLSDREARGVVDGQFLRFHHCRHCGGWIPGERHAVGVNTIGPLCGRRGMEYYCARCGREIEFVGMMS